MRLLSKIRRAFAKDTNVLQCKPCGLSIAETARESQPTEPATQKVGTAS
jgi:hypothetical protein